MPDYKNGKIYMLESKEGNVRYYGSTVQSLKERLRKHKVDKKRYEEVKNRYYTSYKILEYSDCEISLVEDYPCNNKKELETRERFYIENNDCVNKFIPTRTLKEWREEKKDEIKQQNKERYEKNKDEIKQKQKEKITCVCGAVVRKNDIRRHERSKKHQEYIKTI